MFYVCYLAHVVRYSSLAEWRTQLQPVVVAEVLVDVVVVDVVVADAVVADPVDVVVERKERRSGSQ